MALDSSLTYENFLTLAKDAGVDTGPDADQAHLQELYSYLKPVLASLRSLDNIDVSQAEPDMSFLLHQN
ncbi:MAG: hypothetical protein BZY88_07565 [SAR202 cluster bacterium Io17-Chloro-G9]|nr:MAG: hypothetical protein BZY88_07565 [SAR202 cluster bacterium Io17-Chloro-G9]